MDYHKIKLRMLGLSEEEFQILPRFERVERLNRLMSELAETEVSINDEIRRIEREISEKRVAESRIRARVISARARLRHLRRLRIRYEVIYAEWRRALGRVGAYSRLVNIAIRRGWRDRERRYRELLMRAREELQRISERLIDVSSRIRAHPPYEEIERRLRVWEGVLSRIRREIEREMNELEMMRARINIIRGVLGDIQKEIEIPVTILHRYTTFEITVHAGIQYESAKRGSDIDVDIFVSFKLKTLIPQRRMMDIDTFIRDISDILTNSACRLISLCHNMTYFVLPIESDIRCSIINVEVIRDEVRDVTLEYVERELMDTSRVLEEELRREMELDVIQVRYWRSNTMGEEKSRNTYAEINMIRCIEQNSDIVLDEVREKVKRDELPILTEQVG
ncbi:MAG: hypothetical protein DRH44_04540 [Candidatus Coatesbacteria bacterium]|nr:MAG: hypothetical protein DRH49_02740 [Candidatus Coatesbacteria bacterium]RLC43666.1 MAG: hypothetical protein DRH44_04540 [Candidatus Coatesbacteria bacterium]